MPTCRVLLYCSVFSVVLLLAVACSAEGAEPRQGAAASTARGACGVYRLRSFGSSRREPRRRAQHFRPSPDTLNNAAAARDEWMPCTCRAPPVQTCIHARVTAHHAGCRTHVRIHVSTVTHIS